MLLNNFLLNKLPFDVIINHIIPFTYKPQPKNLLRDIRSFYHDYQMLDNYYTFDSNNMILIHDLVRFCNNNRDLLTETLTGFYVILRRHFHFKTRDPVRYIITQFYDNIHSNIDKKTKFLWGLFTPRERTAFINRYIISALQEN